MQWFFIIILTLSSKICADFDSFRSMIETLNPSVKVNEISKISGTSLLSVELSNGQNIYTDSNASHFFTGDLYKIDGNNIINLTKVSYLAHLNLSDLVVFEANGPVKHILTIFTDIDCGYCRKLHLEMDEINSAGIEVRYVAFPRDGKDSISYRKYLSVLCSSDRKLAMTQAKQGKKIIEKSCSNNISDQFLLGQRLGVNGTPTIFLENGQAIPGYLPLNELLTRLE